MTVRYSCETCHLVEIHVDVPEREDEDIKTWMEMVSRKVWADHWRRSPYCEAATLSQLKIPVTGVKKIGGPPVH